MLANPMRIHIFPNAIARYLPASIGSTAVGDLILLVPIMVFILRGSHYTFIEPSLERSGYMSAYCIFAAYLSANKSNSLFTWLFGIPYERLVDLHWFSSVSGVVLGAFHCYVSYVFGGDDNGDSRFSKAFVGGTPNFGKFLFDGVNNWSGTILLDAMAAMVLMSFFQFLRRHAFNIWYFLHMIFGVTILIMLFLHSVPSAAFVTAWWALDLVVRYAVMAGLKNVTRAKLRIIGAQHRGKARLVEMIVQKPEGFQYNAGQFIRLAVPALSAVEFHPITIASAPDEPYIVLQVRKLGDWTERLVELAETTEFTDVLLEGPYGAPSVDLEDDDKYNMILCVSGGIGVTPCQSIGKHLLLKHRQEGRRLKKLNFVWAVRDLQMVEDIPPLFLGTPATFADEEMAQVEENYSKSSPEYQRMMERAAYYHSSAFGGDVDTPHATGFELLRRPAVVQADIYCTRQKLQNDIERANATLSLPYNLYSGRPDLDEIFQEMKQQAIVMGETNIAVIGCGPAPLIDAVQAACHKHSSSVLGAACMEKDSVFFDFHKEHFEL